MKAIKLFLSLLIVCLLGSTAQAAITRGQTFTGTTGGTNQTSLALTVTAPDLTDGKYHYMVIAASGTNGPTATSDSGYSFFDGQLTASASTGCSLLIARVFSGAGTTITLTAISASPIAAVGAEYKSDAPLRIDRVMSNTGSSTTLSTGTTSTTSNANELCVAALVHRCQTSSSTGSYTSPTNSYAEISAGGKSTTLNTATNDRETDLLEKFLTSTGTTTTGATVTGSFNWAAIVMTMEEVTSPATRIPSIGY